MAASRKKCPQCHQVRSLLEFGKNASAADGRQCWCRDCRSADKANKCERVRSFITAYKLAVGCEDCGCKGPAYVLDFDHKRDKAFVIGESAARNPKTVLQEMVKCDIVCANCHRIRHHAEYTEGAGVPPPSLPQFRSKK